MPVEQIIEIPKTPNLEDLGKKIETKVLEEKDFITEKLPRISAFSERHEEAMKAFFKQQLPIKTHAEV